MLQKRADVLKKIRDFFYQRNVMEVEVPLMAGFGVTDPYNENVITQHLNKPCQLQTSPEYHLKRLLCAGSGHIYSLAKAFRDEPSGNYHNVEFTMLEWYRLNWDYQQLINEVLQLIQLFLPSIQTQRFSYQQLFQYFCDFDPFTIDELGVAKYAMHSGLVDRDLEMDKDAWLALIMGQFIEPQLQKQGGCCVIYDFPKSQASLAVVEGEIAKRFEIYLYGIELANGFQELKDPVIQYQRFEADNEQRQKKGLKLKAIDPYFMAALEHGLPECSGVALGIDRLIMAVVGADKIEQVLSFTINNA